MQTFSEMQTDIEFDLRPKPYPSGTFLCAHLEFLEQLISLLTHMISSSEKTLFWHLASEKNSKTNGERQSEFG
jgi:hypothetical protein